MKQADFVDRINRFWSKIQRGGPDECWPWTGEVNNRGYGRFHLWDGDRRTRLFAHRLALVFSGFSVPQDCKVLHRCDNPPCCNPSHLFIGTQTDNMRDALAKGRLNLSGLDLGRGRPGWDRNKKEHR